MIVPNCLFSVGTADYDQRLGEHGDIAEDQSSLPAYVENINNAPLSRMPMSFIKDGPERVTHFLYVDRSSINYLDDSFFPKGTYIQITHREKGRLKIMTELESPEIYTIGFTAKADMYENTLCIHLMP